MIKITNTFLLIFSGDEKPNYAEVGPFVYQQIMNKTNIEFSQDGDEITHSVYREFYFTRSLSVSSDDTYVIVPNIPLFGLIKKLSNSDAYTKSAARSLLEGYKGGIILESFSHWLKSQKQMCQITTLNTVQLKKVCSG
jgi:hypothetical protein